MSLAEIGRLLVGAVLISIFWNLYYYSRYNWWLVTYLEGDDVYETAIPFKSRKGANRSLNSKWNGALWRARQVKIK